MENELHKGTPFHQHCLCQRRHPERQLAIEYYSNVEYSADRPLFLTGN